MVSLELQLQRAIQWATQQHQYQVDKGGQAYIAHPLRVMQQLTSLEAKIVAVLHDVLEDTASTREDLLHLGIEPSLILAIEAMSKRMGENRFQAAQRTRLNALACEVKLADLQDNMDLSRLVHISSKDRRRQQQYCQIQHLLQIDLKIHQHYQALGLLPKLNQSRQQHYLSLLSALLPEHPLLQLRALSHYFHFCKRHQYHPDIEQALHVIALPCASDAVSYRAQLSTFITWHFKSAKNFIH